MSKKRTPAQTTTNAETFKPLTADQAAEFPRPADGKWGLDGYGVHHLQWTAANGKPVMAPGDGFLVMGSKRSMRPKPSWLPDKWEINTFPAGWTPAHLAAWFDFAHRLASNPESRSEARPMYFPTHATLLLHARSIARHLGRRLPATAVSDNLDGNLDALAELRRVCCGPAEVKSDTPPHDSTATLAAVSKPGKLILGALLKYYPTLQTIEEICKELKDGLSERTVGPELKTLIKAGLAERPKGKGKGATLTPAGKAQVEKFPASR